MPTKPKYKRPTITSLRAKLLKAQDQLQIQLRANSCLVETFRSVEADNEGMKKEINRLALRVTELYGQNLAMRVKYGTFHQALHCIHSLPAGKILEARTIVAKVMS